MKQQFQAPKDLTSFTYEGTPVEVSDTGIVECWSAAMADVLLGHGFTPLSGTAVEEESDSESLRKQIEEAARAEAEAAAKAAGLVPKRKPSSGSAKSESEEQDKGDEDVPVKV